VGTAIGVIVGVLATVFVGQYYFRRTVNKSLGVYGLLNSYVFAGIAGDVRRQLNFRFQDKDVKELQQLVFLVANDGEKAIRDMMAPMKLSIPGNVEVLDASIIHKKPDDLTATIAIKEEAQSTTGLCLDFPLLNKGEFFVVKLLLSGQLPIEKVRFAVLAEDLPRSLSVMPAPPTALREEGFRVEWSLAVVATLILLFVAWAGWWLLVLRESRPELFPVPWNTFRVTIEAAFLLIPALLFLPVLGIIGMAMVAAAAFGGEFPPSRTRKFPLPKELQEAVFPFAVANEGSLKPVGWTEPKKDARPARPDAVRSGDYYGGAEPDEVR
jgi:hypothetical protein